MAEKNTLPAEEQVNDTNVQTDLPEPVNGELETQKPGKVPYMVTIGSQVYSVEAEDATEAGNLARKQHKE